MFDIYWPIDCKAPEKLAAFKKFVQQMANRLVVGTFQYDKGKPVKAAKYLTRLEAEIKAYRETGNQEHLINASNYCFLEIQAPEHKKSNFKHESKSITRDVLGMKFLPDRRE